MDQAIALDPQLSKGAGQGKSRRPRSDDLLRLVNSGDGSTVGSVTITLAGLTVNGGTGLARHPQTDTLYALLKIQGRTFPDLVTLNESTGVAAFLGLLYSRRARGFRLG
jgi:hypothetical protein